MSDNATLKERLLNNRAPAIFEAARMAAARIAELEAERDRLAKAFEEAVTDAREWKRRARQAESELEAAAAPR